MFDVQLFVCNLHFVLVFMALTAILNAMKHVEKVLVCTLFLLVLGVAAKAVTADSSTTANPYQGIVDRNVFGLTAPPPPPAPVDTKPPPAKITLTGITTIFGNKRALLKAPVPAKPGPPVEPAHDQTYMLAEGQRDGDIEVLEIDEKKGTVKVNNSDTIVTLNFDDNGIKLSSTLPAGAPVPGMAPPPAGGIQAPANRPGGGFNTTFPTRTLRLPGVNGASMPATSMNPGGVAPAAANGASLPGFSFGSASGGTTTTAQPAQLTDGMTPDQIEALIALNHQKALQDGSHTANLFPPTPAFPNRNRNLTPTAQPPGSQSGL